MAGIPPSTAFMRSEAPVRQTDQSGLQPLTAQGDDWIAMRDPGQNTWEVSSGRHCATTVEAKPDLGVAFNAVIAGEHALISVAAHERQQLLQAAQQQQQWLSWQQHQQQQQRQHLQLAMQQQQWYAHGCVARAGMAWAGGGAHHGALASASSCEQRQHEPLLQSVPQAQTAGCPSILPISPLPPGAAAAQWQGAWQLQLPLQPHQPQRAAPPLPPNPFFANLMTTF